MSGFYEFDSPDTVRTTVFVSDFRGDGSTAAFNLTSNPFSVNNTQVYIDGVYQEKTGYSVSGVVLTFSQAPPNLSTIEVTVLAAENVTLATTSADLVTYTPAASGALITDVQTELRKLSDSDGTVYTPAGTGAVVTTVQAKLRETVSVKDFGAVGNGTTDDTAAIKAAITAATPSSSSEFIATGGRTVHIPSGKYKISSNITVPKFVNLLGEGKGITSFLCSASASRLQFGDVSASTRGGLSGHFTIDGNNVATNPFYIGLCVERSFEDIDVIKSASDGLIIEGAQNCVFTCCGFQDNGASGSGSGLVLDLGAGNNRFIGCEINKSAQNNVRFRQSGTSPSGAFTVPTQNRFYGCMIERFDNQTNFNGSIFHGNGRLNKFDKCDISLTGLTSVTNVPLVRMERTVTSKASSNLLFDSCSFNGTASRTTVFDGQGASGVLIDATFTGQTFVENHGKVFRLNDFCTVDLFNIVNSSGGTFFTGLGSKTQNELISAGTNVVILKLSAINAGDDTLSVQKAGEAYPRWIHRPNGLNAGGGAAPTDAVLSRGTAAGVPCFVMSVPQKINNTAAVQTSGAGAPSIGLANGSIYHRTDGSGTADNLYVRRGGAWVGIA